MQMLTIVWQLKEFCQVCTCLTLRPIRAASQAVMLQKLPPLKRFAGLLTRRAGETENQGMAGSPCYPPTSKTKDSPKRSEWEQTDLGSKALITVNGLRVFRSSANNCEWLEGIQNKSHSHDSNKARQKLTSYGKKMGPVIWPREWLQFRLP